jgi:hypothetical protein
MQSIENALNIKDSEESMKLSFISILIIIILFACQAPVKKEKTSFSWQYFSSKNGDIEVPNIGNQQTASAVYDINLDGYNDFIITERSNAPAVVWYQRIPDGWKRHIIDTEPLHIEAGSAVSDIDGDNDLDVVFAGDFASNQVWWWENPYPEYTPNKPWQRHTIKNSGSNKHHDQLFADFDGDGKEELVFWNQNDRVLYLAEIPEDPKQDKPWELASIYSYSDDSEPPQRGTYPGWKGVNEHEGLDWADMDGDGKLDILGGGRWFKHIEDHTFEVNIIDEGYCFSRIASGQFIEGGKPEVVIVVGDGRAPLMFYQWINDKWLAKVLIDSVQDGHSLDVIDFNGDGYLDIFNAEMRLGKNPQAKTRILLGDGKGNFQIYVIHEGFGLHESRIADLDGDTDYDILGKPYTWEAPRLDIWLNTSPLRF